MNETQRFMQNVTNERHTHSLMHFDQLGKNISLRGLSDSCNTKYLHEPQLLTLTLNFQNTYENILVFGYCIYHSKSLKFLLTII